MTLASTQHLAGADKVPLPSPPHNLKRLIVVAWLPGMATNVRDAHTWQTGVCGSHVSR